MQMLLCPTTVQLQNLLYTSMHRVTTSLLFVIHIYMTLIVCLTVACCFPNHWYETESVLINVSVTYTFPTTSTMFLLRTNVECGTLSFILVVYVFH